MISYGVLVLVALVIALSEGFFIHGKPNIFNKPRTEEVKIRAESTIVMSHVLFRHGNRTPDLIELYPNDPYLNYSYYPLTDGELTAAGKRKEFSIGVALRERYDDLLGMYYVRNNVEAWSTDRNRTKMSLLLVLASLFPPKCSEVWNSNLNWQPVPYNYRRDTEDPVLYGISCPTYLTEYRKVQQSADAIATFNESLDTNNYIAENSGLNITVLEDVYNLNFGLSTEYEYGLTLPDWTKEVWPEPMNEISIKQYYVYTQTTLLRKMAAGYLIKKIIDDFERAIRNETETKLFLYSAHENNLGQLLVTLDIFEYPHIPTYGSYILMEGHLINDTYGFKIYYQNYNGTAANNPKLLKLPACEEFCPLDEFKALVEENLPEDGLCGN